MLSRRLFLGGLGASFGAALTPRLLRAADGAGGRRFLFVYNPGGWDPLFALAPMHGAAGVQMAVASAGATAGGIRYVDTPATAVRAFFEAWHDRTALVHGVSVPSVSHEICTRLVLTGKVGADRPDWATRIGAAAAEGFTVPSFVLGGPSFPGALGSASARTGATGQLQSLLDGSILDASDQGVGPRFQDATNRLLDRYATARTRARADGAIGGADATLSGAWAEGTRRAQDLRDASYDLSFGEAYDLRGQLDLAVNALSRGLCRVASVSTGGYGGWDTHQNNDTGQTPLFDQLFTELSGLLARLASTPSPSGGALLDETVVVVCSEMGRTPTYNANAGRDHWPFTSMMLLGSGIAGDRVIGGYDDAFFGEPIDLASGEVAPTGAVPTVDHIGATLLRLADVDPGDLGVAPIGGVLT